LRETESVRKSLPGRKIEVCVVSCCGVGQNIWRVHSKGYQLLHVVDVEQTVGWSVRIVSAAWRIGHEEIFVIRAQAAVGTSVHGYRIKEKLVC